jgi:hypothetical protein
MAPNSTGDEHSHHPLCEACGQEFATVDQLSMHIDQAHRGK